MSVQEPPIPRQCPRQREKGPGWGMVPACPCELGQSEGAIVRMQGGRGLHEMGKLRQEQVCSKGPKVRETPEPALSHVWNWAMWVLTLPLDRCVALGEPTPVPTTGFPHDLATPRLQPRPRTRGRAAQGWGRKMDMEGV